MKRDELLETCDRAIAGGLRHGADEIEVAAVFSRGGEVSFEKNDLNVALTDEETTFGIRVFRDHRQGFATTNDPAQVDAAVADAIALAGASIPDPLNGLPDARPVEDLDGLHDPELAGLGIEALTELGSDLLDVVRATDRRASIDSGSCSVSESLKLIRSSRGVLAAERSTGIGCSLFGMAVADDQVGSFVVEGRAARRLEGFRAEVEACGKRFAEKAVALLDPGRGRSYKGALLFAPEATAQLFVGNLLGMLSPAAIRKGKSPFEGRPGEPVASPLVELVDRPRAAGEPGATAFDREGMPKRDHELLIAGELRSLPYDHYEARAAGREGGSTGHAAGGVASAPTVGVSRAILSPGDRPLDELLKDAEGAVVVSRFSGSTNAVTGEFSGVVKGGFIVEEGRLRPVTETLIAGNLLDLYRSVIAISIETEKLYGRLSYPWMLLDGVSVTAG